MKLRKEFEEGIKAPWYYGHAYYDLIDRNSVCYIVPIHLLIRLVYRQTSSIDSMMQEYLNRLERRWNERFTEEMDIRIRIEIRAIAKKIRKAIQE